MHSRGCSTRGIDAGILLFLGFSRKADSAPSGRTEIELSQSTVSSSATESRLDPPMCRSTVRPAWEMLGLGSGILRTTSTLVPLVLYEMAVMVSMQRLRSEGLLSTMVDPWHRAS